MDVANISEVLVNGRDRYGGQVLASFFFRAFFPKCQSINNSKLKKERKHVGNLYLSISRALNNPIRPVRVENVLLVTPALMPFRRPPVLAIISFGTAFNYQYLMSASCL